MGLTFEWDENKSKQNLKKHGVSFEEAAVTWSLQPINNSHVIGGTTIACNMICTFQQVGQAAPCLTCGLSVESRL